MNKVFKLNTSITTLRREEDELDDNEENPNFIANCIYDFLSLDEVSLEPATSLSTIFRKK